VETKPVLGIVNISYIMTLRGNPFPQPDRIRSVIKRVFPSADVEVKSDEGDKTVVSARSINEKDDDGSVVTEMLVKNDLVAVQKDYYDVALDDIEKDLKVPGAVFKKVYESLRSEFFSGGRGEKTLELSDERVNIVIKGFKCRKWLENNSAANPIRKMCDAYSGKNDWLIRDARLINLMFALHEIPRNLKDVEASVLRRVETVSSIRMAIESAADWEEGVVSIEAVLKHLSEKALFNFLRAIMD
jgi:hypothetical protein